jgi:hypothetical protein
MRANLHQSGSDVRRLGSLGRPSIAGDAGSSAAANSGPATLSMSPSSNRSHGVYPDARTVRSRSVAGLWHRNAQDAPGRIGTKNSPKIGGNRYDLYSEHSTGDSELIANQSRNGSISGANQEAKWA